MNDNSGFDNRMNQANQNNTNSNMQGIHDKDRVNKDSDFYKQTAGLKGAKRDSSKGIDSSKSPKSSSSGSSGGSTSGSSSRSSSSSSRSGGGLSNKTSANRPITSRPKSKMASTGAQALGVPKPLADKAVNSNMGQRLLEISRKRSWKMRAFDKITGAGKEETKEEDKDNNNPEENQGDPTEPTDKKSENKVEEISIRIPFKIKLALIISSCVLGIFMILLIAIINTDTIQKIIANRFAVTIFDDKDSAADIDEDGNNSGEWIQEDDDAYIERSTNIYLKDHYIDDSYSNTNHFTAYSSSKDVDLSALHEYYKLNCSGDACEKTNLYKFYRKMYDIYFMYKYKYKVKIDLALLMSTLNYNSRSQDDMFLKNQGEYEIDDVRADDYNNENTTILDWENDFKNLDGYKYLNANDYRYDMQILAKNMVKKTITYKCVSESDNSKSKSKNAEDIETTNYEKELKCDKGYKLDSESVEAKYKYDKDKYDDFLLEYIEHKFFLKGYDVDPSSTQKTGEETIGGSGSNSMGEAMVKVGLQEYEKFKKGQSTAYTYQSAQGIGAGVAWCAAFVSYVSKHTKVNGKTVADIVGITTASTGVFIQHFHNKKGIDFYYNDSCSYLKGKNGKGKKYLPKPGDYIFFDWDHTFRDYSNVVPGSGPQDHTAMVQKYSKGKVYTIEGNNGNAVRTTSYDITNCSIIGYGSWY